MQHQESSAMHEMRLRKGSWLEEEDEMLATAVAVLGDKRWDSLAKASGLRRSGKSCRLRWMNYLRPNLKRGQISAEEERIIVKLHAKWGNKWSRIAEELPGRTDNEIKNYWRSYKKRKTNAATKDITSSTISSSGNESLTSEQEKSTTSPCSVTGDCFSFKSDVQGFTPDSSGVSGMFNLTVSPYNTRLTASMSNWFPDINKQEINDGYSNFHNPEWISYNSNINIWDFPSWD